MSKTKITKYGFSPRQASDILRALSFATQPMASEASREGGKERKASIARNWYRRSTGKDESDLSRSREDRDAFVGTGRREQIRVKLFAMSADLRNARTVRESALTIEEIGAVYKAIFEVNDKVRAMMAKGKMTPAGGLRVQAAATRAGIALTKPRAFGTEIVEKSARGVVLRRTWIPSESRDYSLEAETIGAVKAGNKGKKKASPEPRAKAETGERDRRRKADSEDEMA